jgi:hypothetical protein
MQCRTVIMVIYLSHNSLARTTANLAPGVPMLCWATWALGEIKGTVKLKSFHSTQPTGRSTSNRPTRSKPTVNRLPRENEDQMFVAFIRRTVPALSSIGPSNEECVPSP